MVWNLMKKNRRPNQSPNTIDSSTRGQRSFFGSKHKRRNIRKNSGVTEGTDSLCSFSSEWTDKAPWRVENIRTAPPKGDEWWTETSCESNNSQDYSEDGEGFEAIVVKASTSSTETRQFNNCGLETWLQARKEWNKRTVETLPAKPTPVEYHHLVRGLTKHTAQRTYELPRKMALSDLIDVYTDIWDGEAM